MTTYETFARVYDSIMDDQLYDQWLAFTQDHLTPDTTDILELACGTGILSLKLDQAGYRVKGLDLSPEMVDLAQKRAQEAGRNIEFIQGNMLALPAVDAVDAVTCYSDSICYLEDEVEVGDAFQQVFQVLKSGGRFLFDVHSIYQMEEVYPGYSYHENAEDFAFVWDSYPDEPPYSIVHELTFFLQEEDGRFVRKDEVHEERTYERLTYEILLEQAGFTNIQMFADFTNQAPDEKSLRWFFVAEKP
ncbi:MULTISPECIES: class I SAM-dependent methyltransferase [unclassified Streptococcus]|uniref:class I SAM-dependent methyltransferase n=1 Tax=unclassified Streptococcus TaxID=2608887 RepID=UPI001071CC98|nr:MULTISPECIES: class I SAM-dependent methyltransferase [unclassified Streptococcus]MBF0806170.1 class I SAM-dependent methyltransferase [Streptococcus sp. 19428wA2_WM07]TFU28233.1 class I SAM-dependent methyltransferase [Streptococcus sp. WM07]